MEGEAMSLIERVYDLGQSAIVAISAGVIGGITWVTRNILLIRQDNELLRGELKDVKAGLNRIETILIGQALQGKEK